MSTIPDPMTTRATLGPLRNVSTTRVTDQAFLKAPMTLLRERARAAGSFDGSASQFYLINANAEPALATLRYRLWNVKMFAAEQPFEVDGRKYNAGSYIIPAKGNPESLAQSLSSADADLALRISGVTSDPSAKRHEISAPRIALIHSWVNTQNEGWYRLALDEMKVPYSYISDQRLRDVPNLREKYDVILYPPVGVGLAALIHGVPKRMQPDGSDFGGPLPWMQTDLTPNLVSRDGQPDQSPDIRGGMGFEASPLWIHARCRRVAPSICRTWKTAGVPSPTGTTVSWGSTSIRRRCSGLLC
jgi:hypothetical protein